MSLADLLPTGCTVEPHGSNAAIHDAKGELIAIICSNQQNNADLARLIVGLPGLLKACEASLENGILLPVARGISTLDLAVFRPQLPA